MIGKKDSLPENAYIEVVRRPPSPPPFRFALFDFDGTLSLIREGWQDIMIPYFVQVLQEVPGAREEAGLDRVVTDFVDTLTGKQTIFQCIRLAEEVSKRGGKPLKPGDYKNEYLRRLNIHISNRIAALEGGADPGDYLVKGSVQLLQLLKDRGYQLFLASGTDEKDVLREAGLLGLDAWFGQRIYGARDDITDCSKELVIRSILEKNKVDGSELLSFGDGFVEIELVAGVGGYTVGLATDERRREGINERKRRRLLDAGADMIIPDFSDAQALMNALEKGGEPYAISAV
ncbi:MAG: HAD family hydrolase [Clostridiales bacterium]|jgi:phosphoglycolate phosphatase|nr:HAD family hydrolase [Clostridiales bacterium]